MNRNILSAIALAAATLMAGHAVAAGPSAGPTRQQVQAELAEAIRTGDVYIGGETNLKANEAFPGSYPARAVAPRRARALCHRPTPRPLGIDAAWTEQCNLALPVFTCAAP